MEAKKIREIIQRGRNFMSPRYKDPEIEEDYQTDQELKKPQPPLTKTPMRESFIDLPMDFENLNIENDFLKVINSRVSHRVYTEEKLSLLQLSYLLWCQAGVKEIRGRAYATLRTVPCGGARHQFEIYMAVQNVEGLEDGLYHYLPLGHKIEFLKCPDDLKNFISEAVEKQIWAARANVVFFYSIDFYRVEWRYGVFAHRVAPIDLGHITENLYLAATSIGLGGCAIGAVDAVLCDDIFELDGENETMLLAMPVGTISDKDIQAEKDFYAFVREQDL